MSSAKDTTGALGGGDACSLHAEILPRAAEEAPWMLLVLNRDWRVVCANRQLLSTLGADSPAEIHGRRLGELWHCVYAGENGLACGRSELCDECRATQALARTLNTGKEEIQEWSIRSRNGRYFDFRLWSRPHRTDADDYVLLYLLDISKEQREDALERMFLHDIENVLTLISGYSAMLAKTSDQSRAERYAGMISQGCSRLTEEIDAHRRLRGLPFKQQRLDRATVRSADVLEELAAMYGNEAVTGSKQVTIASEIDDVKLVTAPVLLRRVLGNMVKNALEAIDSSEVLLSCRSEDGQATFTVHNAGEIPLRIQKQIFNRSFSTKGPGRGIGTYSMKLFGEEYLSGQVGFSSSANTGTRFFITLPAPLE